MPKWKQQKKTKYSAQYLHFEEGKEKEMTITDWDFGRNANGSLFKCYVVKEDGEEVDKIWSVWDYESTQALKKKLGVKYVSPATIKVVMHKEDGDSVYKLV